MDLTLVIACFSPLPIDNGTQFSSMKMRFLITKTNKMEFDQLRIHQVQTLLGRHHRKITSAIDLVQHNVFADCAAKTHMSTMVQSA